MEPNPQRGKRNRPVSPVDRVIAAFGVKRAAVIADVTSDALRKWNRSSATGGGGGLVPARHQPKDLAEAERAGVALTAADLVSEPH